MPELPEVEAVRRQLEPVMQGTRFARVIVRREGLRRPFPARFASRLRGTTVRSLTRRGKYLLAELSSGETLLMHLGMSGSFEVAPAKASRAGKGSKSDPHDHVVFEMSSGSAITYNDPRRFGVMDLVSTRELDRHRTVAAIGPEPLSPAFDADALAQAVKGRRTSLKAAMLDQRVVAGLGNIYASEALHLAGLSPRRRASSIATASGAPRDAAVRLVAAIKKVVREAIGRNQGRRYRGGRFRVYDREGEPCLTDECKSVVRRITQAGRSTFYCAVCQR
jgi:formamidopyrimidine-DNA glycosylase